MRAWMVPVLALVLVACPREEEADPERTRLSAEDAGEAEAEAEAEAAGLREAAAPGEIMIPTGILSEDAFKRLHSLKKEAAPPPRGKTIEVDGSRAYLSMPSGGPGSPGVLLIHEWWGLNDHIRHWADRLAEAGYIALAVDLFGGRTTADPDVAAELVKEVDPDHAMSVLRAARDTLADTPGVEASRIGVLGWCFGGAWSLRAGIRLEGLDAVVMYYGRLVEDPKELEQIEAPLLAVFGNQDPSIPPESVERFAQALEAAGVDHRILRYDAEHAFANPSQESYDTRAAARAWEEVQGFLRARLGRAGGRVDGGTVNGDTGAVQRD